MPVEGTAAGRCVIRYIDAVRKFKVAIRSGEIKTREFQRKQREFDDYYAEGRGRRTGHRSSQIDYISHHGDIVDALQEWRTSNPMPGNSRIVKNIYFDMGVERSKKLVEVFEVKTSTARPFVYSALGQLLVHGSSNDCRRFMVLPYDEILADDLAEALKRLRVDILRFKLDKNGATVLKNGKHSLY